tara:strand:+ start:2384 stop:2494 length:111 start_codon:yes stop_codon:yes gene_type:complete
MGQMIDPIIGKPAWNELEKSFKKDHSHDSNSTTEEK